VLRDAAIRFLDVQLSTDDILDTRNASVFAISSTVLPLTFGLLNLTSKNVPDFATAALIGALICYVLVLVCSWRASLIRGLEYRPHLPTLRANAKSTGGETLLMWVALEQLASTEANKPGLKKKARMIGFASTFLYGETFLVSLAALIALL
jgi:hypothetical protein